MSLSAVKSGFYETAKLTVAVAGGTATGIAASAVTGLAFVAFGAMLRGGIADSEFEAKEQDLTVEVVDIVMVNLGLPASVAVGLETGISSGYTLLNLLNKV